MKKRVVNIFSFLGFLFLSFPIFAMEDVVEEIPGNWTFRVSPDKEIEVPREVHGRILSHLDPLERVPALCVSKAWKAVGEGTWINTFLDVHNAQLGEEAVRLLLSLPQLLVRNITRLDVSGNNLKEHVSGLCYLPSLTELDAGYNEIGKYGSALSCLTSLTSLAVNFNGLTKHARFLSHLTGLTYLDVSNNGLAKHANVLSHLPDLKYLVANFNSLGAHVSVLAFLTTNLTKLCVTHNGFGEHVSALAHLTHLRYLNVHRNEVGEYISTLRPLIEAGTKISSDSL